jgi:hypothetical protein
MLSVLEKNKISVFSGLNDISHLLDQTFRYITEIKIQSK